MGMEMTTVTTTIVTRENETGELSGGGPERNIVGNACEKTHSIHDRDGCS